MSEYGSVVATRNRRACRRRAPRALCAVRGVQRKLHRSYTRGSRSVDRLPSSCGLCRERANPSLRGRARRMGSSLRERRAEAPRCSTHGRVAEHCVAPAPRSIGASDADLHAHSAFPSRPPLTRVSEKDGTREYVNRRWVTKLLNARLELIENGVAFLSKQGVFFEAITTSMSASSSTSWRVTIRIPETWVFEALEGHTKRVEMRRNCERATRRIARLAQCGALRPTE